ncbi:MAG: hypothetical protein ACFFDN_48540 [Candidatus Hodarchaeota archaeon]
MPEDNEKVEDFISLWRKKMETEIKQPSALSETLERIKEVERENEELRNKIQENIELISRTEEIVKNTIDENERLKQEISQAGMIGGIKISDIQQENIALNNRIITLEKDLTEKEVELRARNNEITELKTKLETAPMMQQSLAHSIPETDTEVTKTLIDDLQSELTKKKIQFDELEKKINELTQENEALNQQLREKIVPAESAQSSVIRPQPIKPSSETLEILCQDLQSDLNKYKRIVEKLNNEKSELQQAIKEGGFKLEPDEIKQLKRENEDLKTELSKIQESLKKRSEEITPTTRISDAEKKINDLQEQLKEKEHLITELKTQQEIQPIVHEGPMSSLIEDLQNKINKLKITLEEKNKIIEELKSS